MRYSDRKHVLRLISQQEEIKRIFDRFARDAGRALERLSYGITPGDALPSEVWVHNSAVEREVDTLLVRLHDDLLANIDTNTREAWEASNMKTDQMISDFIADLTVSQTVKEGMFYRNAEALKTFLKRKHDGMNLSERIWKVSEGAKENLEYYLASGLSDGRPAALIAQDIRYCLKEPDRRFHRIRDYKGRLVASQPMKEYRPGRGIYRSSYKNAIRVGATETNIAYHEADHQRWKNLNFVLGVKVDRSPTSKEPCKICDAMKGTYPKGFKFLPWHPFCICQATPVMLSGAEFTSFLIDGNMPAGRVLKDMPENALEYIETNPNYKQSYAYTHNAPFFRGNSK